MGKIIKKEAFEKSLSLEERLGAMQALETKDEAKRLFDAVSEEFERKKKEGYEIGYQEGLAEVTERLTALAKLEDEFLKDAEKEVLRLVYEIAEKVLNRELAKNKKSIVEIVKGALRELSGTSLVVRLNPKDLAVVKESEPELSTTANAMATFIFKEDEAVEPGGCVVESEIGTIDAKWSTQLAAIKRALGLE